MKKSIKIKKEKENERLDKFIAEHLPNLSRTKIKKHILLKNIVVNAEGKKPSYLLRENDIISITINPDDEFKLKPFAFKLNVLYEDKDIIVIDKPENLVVHPPNRNYHKTLINALLFMDKELSSLDSYRPGVVHRLDKETSGVIVLAKNDQAYLNIVSQFKQRAVKKEYRAIVWGLIKENRLKVNLPLKRDRRNRLKMKVGLTGAKEAQTEIRVLERFTDSTFISLKPLTGRMHQIRVHLKFLGYPIVGDKKYGRKDKFNSLFLHSYSLGFSHPRTNEVLKFLSPLPERFKDFIKERNYA